MSSKGVDGSCQFNVVIIMFGSLQWQSSIPCVVYDFYQVQSLFCCCKCNKRKACTSCLVGSRSSELTAHNIYDLLTGLAVTCRMYLLWKGSITVDLCQTEKLWESIHFLNVILIFLLWHLTGLVSWLRHLFLYYVFILLFCHFISLGKFTRNISAPRN